MNEKNDTEIQKNIKVRIKTKSRGRPRNIIKTDKDRNAKNLKRRPSNVPIAPRKKPVKTIKSYGPVRYTMPFEEARNIVHSEGIGSRNDFIRWWNNNIPARIPKNPARTYANEGWISWGDFLGTYNAFPNPKIVYRSFHDAKNYARSLKLKTKLAWVELGRAGKIPSDIPIWPNLAYGRTIYTGKPKRGGHWVSWKDWLGSTLSDQMVALKEKLNVLIIARVNGFPSNVYSFIPLNDFEIDIKVKIKTGNYEIIKMYHTNVNFDWGNILSSKYNLYYNTTGAYIIPNIHELLYFFDMQMPKATLSA